MSFANLPTELWLMIAEDLCSHCCPSIQYHEFGCPRDPDNSGPEVYVGLAALASLSRTCRGLYYIATPILYHRPATRELHTLFKTLIRSPQLALHVREMFDMVLDEEAMRPSVTPSVSMSMLGSNMLNLCRNAETAYLTHNIEVVAAMSRDGSLPKLKSAILFKGRGKSFIHDYDLGRLAAAAPNLTSLYLERFTALSSTRINAPFPGWPCFPNVTTLSLVDLRVGIYTRNVGGLIASFPRLETFELVTYNSTGSAGRFIGAETLGRALLRHAPGLRSLHVDESEVYYRWARGRFISDSVWVMSLAPFSRLEYLWIEGATLLRAKNLSNGGFRLDLFLWFLPPMLKELHVSWNRMPLAPFMESLRTLARGARLHFPSLRSVHFRHMIESRRTEVTFSDLPTLFAQQGIHFASTGYGHEL